MSAAKTSLVERLIGKIGRGIGKGIEHGRAASHSLLEMNRRLEKRLLDKLEADCKETPRFTQLGDTHFYAPSGFNLF